MRKKILIVSLFTVVLVALLPMTAVVGTDIIKSNGQRIKNSYPLFEKRVNNVLQKETEHIKTEYLGKGRFFNMFYNSKTSLHDWFDKAIKITDKKPEILKQILNRLCEIPKIVNLLNKNDISKEYLTKEITMTLSDSTILREKIDDLVRISEENHIELTLMEPPKPLGFSGQVGCLLTFFLVIFPMIAMIGGFLSAILAIIIPGTILIPGCLEDVFQKVFEGLIEGFQGLTPP